MTAAAVEPEPVPLTRDAAGRLMVMGTRVPLDTLVSAFERGDSRRTSTSPTRPWRSATSTRS